MRMLMATAAAAVLTTTAMAADLPMGPSPVAYAAPIFTWSGFYVGLNAGAAFRDNDRGSDYVYSANGLTAPGTIAAINADLALVPSGGGDRSGFTGGAQVGYNWQWGQFVVGIEADVNAISRGDRGNSYTIVGIAGSGDDLSVFHSRRGGNWFATLRPRVGFALDRTLLYLTGGFAYGRGGGNSYAVLEDCCVELSQWNSGRRSGSNWGWTLGAGVEHAFSNNWTAKLEYLYVDLDRGRNRDYVSTNPVYADIVGRRGSEEGGFHVVRVGLNYKFGGAGSAVLARY